MGVGPSILSLLALIFLFSCSTKTHKVYTTKCERTLYLRAKYCNTKHALSDRIQHLSVVRIYGKNGKSLKIGVRHKEGIRGICIPRKYKKYLGNSKIVKVKVLRCGDRNLRKCPRKIRGYASWYGWEFAGRRTASGVIFNPNKLYAAHRYLPFGTILKVKNLKNGRTVIVKVVDRGPYVRGRHLDLSYGAAKKLGMLNDGVIPFEAEVLRCGN